MRRLLTYLLLSAAMCTSNAQSNDFRAVFDAFRKQVHQDYEDFRSKANEEYAEFVKKAWETFQGLPPVERPKEKPLPPVVIDDDNVLPPLEDVPVVIDGTIPLPDFTPQPKPVAPVPEQSESNKEHLTVFLYGTEMKVRAGESLKFKISSATEEDVSKAWKHLSSLKYNNLLRDCLELRIRHKLCDWAYLRLLARIGSDLLGADSNEAELLKAYLFCQSGYQMRLAFDGVSLHMLYGSKFYIYDQQCWLIDKEYFYADRRLNNTLRICKIPFPHEQALSLQIVNEQDFTPYPVEERTLKATTQGGIDVTVQEDKNLIDFYLNYPVSYYGEESITRWAIYANTPLSSAVRERLYPQLKVQLEGKDEYDAVNTLCRWVQTAFKYEYDDQVWGGDRAFFADETLYYPGCDCEDRSILLTRIVRDLYGLSCALVYYPGHLATAIALGEEAKGDYIMISGVKHIVCDPTYIGANIGRTMPGMDNAAAKVVLLQ